MSNNAHELSTRLLNALDNNYNVVDMHTVNEIVSILEKFNITKELLETTRLGKHVNELRRKTTDPSLARRAKVLVKRWRDLVIPTVASPGHTGSNRSSAERNVRRLGGTPLTSPALALSRQVVSPAVPSPRPPSRPAWGGYESDSQDVILVDDDPPPPPPPAPAPAPPAPAPALLKPATPPVKRPPSPEPLYDDKKAKRDKKPKKRRGHSRTGTETPGPGPGVVPGATGATGGATGEWRDRNGTERRRNGCRKEPVDVYTALVNRMPHHGTKKNKTTKELLEEIQSRGNKAGAGGVSPGDPHSPDVMLIEPDAPIKLDSPLRNGTSPPPSPPRAPTPLPPLEDERPYRECTCGEDIDDTCLAARTTRVLPLHVHALHNTYLPGINGTRAPMLPHKFAVRHTADPEKPELFASIVPLFKYSDYADDGCSKNMSKVPLCEHLPWTEFAPDPPPLPPPLSPPPPRPYPIDEETPEIIIKEEIEDEDVPEKMDIDCLIVEAEMVSVPALEPSERLKAPILSTEDETAFKKSIAIPQMDVEETFETKHQDHRTVERTKEELNGQKLYDLISQARDNIPYDYSQLCGVPVLTLPEEEIEATQALDEALTSSQDCPRDEFGRPVPPSNFSEWHECAKLGDLIALPYVVID